MEKCKFLILGAGPAGLTFANALREAGQENFIVCEKEKYVGGLCRSTVVDGAPLDVGGGHFLDVRRPEANKFLFHFMPENEWNLFDRDSRIEIDGMTIGYPMEAHIWQMPLEMQILYLKSIAYAGCNVGLPKPEKFKDWIRWKLGDMICDNYMIPYNSKMYGMALNHLGTYWLDKLPNVSFDETLRSCLKRTAYGSLPGHSRFYYPKKYGYGELWSRMAEEITPHMRYEWCAESIDFNQRIVGFSDQNKIEAEYIIMTIPWTSVEQYEGMPSELAEDIKELKYTSINITYIPQTLDTSAHWIYCPDLQNSYHRILVRSNFYEGGKGYWTETNSERYVNEGNLSFFNEYAYPLNTMGKPAVMDRLLKWSKERAVLGLGRWGEWQHYNSDVVVERALKLAANLLRIA